jgi:hypothetical protein
MILMTCLEVKPGLRWVRSPTGGGMRGAADRALLKLDMQDKLERVAKAVQIGGLLAAIRERLPDTGVLSHRAGGARYRRALGRRRRDPRVARDVARPMR